MQERTKISFKKVLLSSSQLPNYALFFEVRQGLKIFQEYLKNILLSVQYSVFRIVCYCSSEFVTTFSLTYKNIKSLIMQKKKNDHKLKKICTFTNSSGIKRLSKVHITPVFFLFNFFKLSNFIKVSNLP